MGRKVDLVAAAEIGRLLGVSRQRVQQLTAHPDFPEPAVIFDMGKAWWRADVLRWAARTGRTVTRDS